MLLSITTAPVIFRRWRTVWDAVFFVLIAGVAGLALPSVAQAASCDEVIGKWAWFTGGVATIKPDGTMVHELGNDGTWECTDAARGGRAG